jgi:putative transposase
MAAAVAVADEVGVRAIVEALGLSRATFYRHRNGRPEALPRPTPARSLSEEENERVLSVLHGEEFVDAAPAEVVATLLSRGEYLCSTRTMYRVLAANREVRERRDRLRRPLYERPQLVATAPNQVWSWDITKLRTDVPFVYLFLYVILDIFSRYVVGWTLAEQETSALAKRLIEDTYLREDVQFDQLTLHADRGTQMVAQTTVQLCAKLGIVRSHNRPYVSNDNPYSESQFGTMKQHSSFPKKFGGMTDALIWARGFFPWYNENHQHSGIAYLTPAQVHRGEVESVIARREAAMREAYERHPERFVRGMPKVALPPEAVWINAPEPEKATEILERLGVTPSEQEVIAQ